MKGKKNKTKCKIVFLKIDVVVCVRLISYRKQLLNLLCEVHLKFKIYIKYTMVLQSSHCLLSLLRGCLISGLSFVISTQA